MIGDRKHDIIGASNTGIDSIGIQKPVLSLIEGTAASNESKPFTRKD